MAWTVHLKGQRITALADASDAAWIPVRAVADALSLGIQVDASAGAIYLVEKPAPLQPLPDPVGTGIKPWHPVDAPIRSEPGMRSAELLDSIIRQFQVSINARHAMNQLGLGETYCNIYVWDVTRALGVEIPHWVTADGRLATPGAAGAYELDANAAIRWLQGQQGLTSGWRQAGSPSDALAAANAGKPVVAAWYAKGAPYIGHLAMVRPGEPHPERGMPIAQAGASNFDDGYIRDGFGDRPVVFFVHD